MTLPFYDHRSSEFLHTAAGRGRRRAATGRIREFEAIDAEAGLEYKQQKIVDRATENPRLFLRKAIGRAVTQDVSVELRQISAEEGADIIGRVLEYLEMFEPVNEIGKEI